MLHEPVPPHAISLALEKFASEYSERRLISRREGEKEIQYLYRSFLAGKEVVDGDPGLFLHKFVSSDRFGELHNHPWEWSVSFILQGKYLETRSQIESQISVDEFVMKRPSTRQFDAGDVNHIRDADFHRVELITPEVWTLFLHGPRIKDWGFVKEDYENVVHLQRVTRRTFLARPKVTNTVG